MRSRKTSNKPKSITPEDRILPAPLSNHAKVSGPALLGQETSFTELSDGSLVETIEDPVDPKRSALAVFKHGRIRIVIRLVRENKILTPVPRMTVGFSEMKLPRGVRPYRSRCRLFYKIVNLLSSTVDLPPEYIVLVASFVLYSWVSDRLPTAVYLSIVGLPQSGKSTLLAVLNLCCRRPVMVSNVSNAALYEACSRIHPTFLFDEVAWHSSTTTRTMRQLLLAGTSASAQVLRVGRSSLSFGPKVLCSLEPCPDQALSSRCIQIPMAETREADGLLKPSDPYIIERADDIRQQLQRFRFNSYKSTRPAKIAGAEQLRPRSRDILASLAAPLAGWPLAERTLLEFFNKYQDPSTREPLEPQQEALVAVIFAAIHAVPAQTSVRIGGSHGLTEKTNGLLQRMGQRTGLTEKGCGSLLTSLGFRSKHRTNEGWILWLDPSTRDRCHQLVKTHGNRSVTTSVLQSFAMRCFVCAGMLP